MNDNIIFNIYLSKKIINNFDKNLLFKVKNTNHINTVNHVIKR